MLKRSLLVIFIVVTVTRLSTSTDDLSTDSFDSSATVASSFEESRTYAFNPSCNPNRLDKGIRCSAVTNPIEIQGGLYSDLELHYVPLASAYYVARLADALGLQKCCPTNRDFLKSLDIMVPWSGGHGNIAIDGPCGYDRLFLRRCTPPGNGYPFLCTGSDGTPVTFGKRLETLSYISILQGANNRWTLFIHCWRAKTPDNPNSQEIATSFNVFNLDPVFTRADRALVIAELNRRGFNTDPSNLIEFDYSNTACRCNS